MFENGRYKNALNRAYYAIFHAMRAVNSLEGFDSSKHSGVIAFFNQTYVKEGIFPKAMSKPNRNREIIKGTLGKITKTEIMAQCPGISQTTVQRALNDLIKNII